MEVKANIQKRRQERLRQLQSRAGSRRQERGDADTEGAGSGRARTGGAYTEGVHTERAHTEGTLTEGTGSLVPPKLDGGRSGGPPLYIRGQSEDDHGGDPEIAWKNRQKQLLTWYAEEERRSGGNGPGRGSHASPSRGSSPDGFRPGRGPFRKLFLIKLVIASILFACVCAVYALDAPWARKAQSYMTAALTEDMDFTRFAAWYGKTFSGSPSLLPAFGDKQEAARVQGKASVRFVQPAKGVVAVPFADTREGVWLTVRLGAEAASMDEGRVEFAGERANSGYTVIIRHAGGYRTTYGGLQPTKWEAGDWLQAGELIGAAQPDGEGKARLYIAVMKDEHYVDPLGVVPID